MDLKKLNWQDKNKSNGGVAQLGERLVRIQEVMGSNPTVSTIKFKALRGIARKAFLLF